MKHRSIAWLMLVELLFAIILTPDFCLLTPISYVPKFLSSEFCGR